MFNKKCSNCEKKIQRDFDFCPYCGNPIKNKEDYGLLGKTDEISMNNEARAPKSMNNHLLDRLIGSAFSTAIKMVEREMKNTEKQEIPNNLQLYINGKKINLANPINNIQQAPKKQEDKEIEQEFDEEGNPVKIIKKVPKISEETLKKSVSLPRKEAKTKLTRLKDKIIYELDTPGINSINNVVINKLEQSLEVKVYTEKAVFIKNIQIKLPLISYSIKSDKLFLEFKG